MKTTVIGFLGTQLDMGTRPERWNKWRPTISLFQQEDLWIDELILLCPDRNNNTLRQVCEDVQTLSPHTHIDVQILSFKDPWDFEEVYGVLYDFVKSRNWNAEEMEYLIHITTGTHVAQICLFLLNEAHFLPGKLLQSSPSRSRQGNKSGSYDLIDLNLARYDRLAQRFAAEKVESLDFLKSGIQTKNARFNVLIEQIEKVVTKSDSPILLLGPTGAGKSHLAKRIYELKLNLKRMQGNFVEVNCATLRGDSAMSSLFGHLKGSFTGAQNDRAGHLKSADGGMLFLDEIGELGLDEQAMLLRAIEDGRFFPVGSDREVQSKFILIAGTNRDLFKESRAGKFREDLLARISLWSYRLPSLRERPEDIEPNLDYELNKWTAVLDKKLSMNHEARLSFLNFATSSVAQWRGNFRDLSAAVTRMVTLSEGGRIDNNIVIEEIQRLKQSWGADETQMNSVILNRFINEEQLAGMDLFDQMQLEKVLQICLKSTSLSDAGRTLFAHSRQKMKTINDSDRLRKYLAGFGLEWKILHAKD